jgi:hypothetical protein
MAKPVTELELLQECTDVLEDTHATLASIGEHPGFNPLMKRIKKQLKRTYQALGFDLNYGSSKPSQKRGR